MGKKQHQSDKLYLTSTEWSTLYGGKKVTKQDADKAEFRRLPFDACSLTLQVNLSIAHHSLSLCGSDAEILVTLVSPKY